MYQDKTKQTIITGQKPAEKLPLARQMRRQPTPAEAKLWTHLRAGRLRGLHFRRQQAIDGFIADFYCHAAGLVVELDGAVHQQQADYDAERTRILKERGLHILRFTNSEVEKNCPGVLREIAENATYHLASLILRFAGSFLKEGLGQAIWALRVTLYPSFRKDPAKRRMSEARR